ncbi:MAG: outer membrane beta-barrel protein [Bacteroidales bacterium]
MRKLCFLLPIILMVSDLSAQKLGFIISDTAYSSAYIYPQTDKKAAHTCLMRLNNKVHFKTCTPDDLLGYGYDKKVFVSYKLKLGQDSAKVFLLTLVDSDMPLFFLKEKNGKRFFVLDDKKVLVELVRQNKSYKTQLAGMYHAPNEAVKFLHGGFTKHGMSQMTVALLDYRELMKEPALHISLQMGITFQNLPVVLIPELAVLGDSFNANSITYSLAADIPVSKYWPLTYHQEIGFNKFVNNYGYGGNPPDYQLIQDFSVLNLPVLLRYTFGRGKTQLFVNAGFQLDIALNNNNLGWLITDGNNNEPGYSHEIVDYASYNTLQPGFAGGFGFNFRMKANLC